MRDLLLTAILLIVVPVSFVFPWVGTIAWTWVSLMYPQRLTYGFAQDLQIAAIIGGATLAGFLLMRARRVIPRGPIPATLGLFVLWMCVTSILAIYPSAIGEMFSKVMKIQLMIFVTMMLLHTRRQIEIFVWAIALSIGFYGLKGGLFTLLTGGGGRVSGPTGSFIAGNNELGLALVMVVPLMYYICVGSSSRAIRWLAGGGMVLTAAAALGTQSRGAFLAVAATAAYLWWKSPQKMLTGFVLGFALIGLVAFMPQTWVDRMTTISHYQQDTSATGRLNAWAMAWNLAVDRPIGGGFEVITPELFQRYAPDPNDLHAAHSIYFQVLGEHGFPGLFLFLLLWFFAWRTARWISAEGARFDDTVWAARLATTVQVALVAYLVGGAFLSLAYFDLPYDLLVIVVALRSIVLARKSEAPARGAEKNPISRAQERLPVGQISSSPSQAKSSSH